MSPNEWATDLYCSAMFVSAGYLTAQVVYITMEPATVTRHWLIVTDDCQTICRACLRHRVMGNGSLRCFVLVSTDRLARYSMRRGLYRVKSILLPLSVIYLRVPLLVGGYWNRSGVGWPLASFPLAQKRYGLEYVRIFSFASLKKFFFISKPYPRRLHLGFLHPKE